MSDYPLENFFGNLTWIRVEGEPLEDEQWVYLPPREEVPFPSGEDMEWFESEAEARLKFAARGWEVGGKAAEWRFETGRGNPAIFHVAWRVVKSRNSLGENAV